MSWLQILISIPVAIVAVAFLRVGWLVAMEMDWFTPIRSDWSDIPLSLRIKHQGRAFVIYLIHGILRSLLFGTAFGCGWMIYEFRHEPAMACLCSIGLAFCLSIMWAAAQAQYEDDRRRAPIQKEFD